MEASIGQVAVDQRPVGTLEDRPARDAVPAAARSLSAAGREARRQDLLLRACAEDVLHWRQSQRPISAETLRKRLNVGAGTARSLVAQLRSDTHIALDSQSEAAT